MTVDCIGCSFCCRKSVNCYIAKRHWKEVYGVEYPENKRCPALEWDDTRWNCGLLSRASEELRKVIAEELKIGEGCACPKNPYVVNRRIPTPEDLTHENDLLNELHKGS